MNKKSTAIIEEYIHIYDIKVDVGTLTTSARLRLCLPRLRSSNLLCVPTGGSAVRAGAEQHRAALRVCRTGAGVHAGAQHHRQGAHGSTAAPARQSQHPPNSAVL